jgi:uncharacterized protein involved in outer membrane biogenesis
VLRRILTLTAAVVVLLIVIAAGVAYWFFGRDGFRRALEAQATSRLGHPVRIASARAQFFPRLAIQLGGIRVGEPAQLTLDDVELSSDLRPLFSGRIENADVRIADSHIDMPLPFGLPREGTKGSDDAEPSEAAVRVVSIRSVALRSVRLRSRGREIVVSGDSSYDGTNLALQRFTAASGGTTLTADGLVALSPRVDARVKVVANRLDVDELLALAAAFAPPPTGPQRAPGPAPRIVATINAEQATAGGVQARNFATQLTHDGGTISLKPLSVELFGGRYEGTITARLGAQLSATLVSKIDDLDVAQLATFGGAADTITGRMSGAGTFNGSGADFAELLRHARGAGTATIVDGTIRRLHLVRTVILFFGRPAPDAGEGTDRFDRLDVGFSLADRVLRAQSFSFHSTDADMTGTGTLNLDSDAVSGRVDVTLSEALSAQAGTDLARYTREGNRVVLPAAIGGTLEMPRLTIDVGAAAKRGIRNEAGRRIKGLLDGLIR